MVDGQLKRFLVRSRRGLAPAFAASIRDGARRPRNHIASAHSAGLESISMLLTTRVFRGRGHRGCARARRNGHVYRRRPPARAARGAARRQPRVDHARRRAARPAATPSSKAPPSPTSGELRAPFSGRRCVAYELTLFDFEGVRPVLLARIAVAHSFLLRDDTRHGPRRPRAGAHRHRAGQALALRADRVDARIARAARGARRRRALARPPDRRLRRASSPSAATSPPSATSRSEPSGDDGADSPYRTLGMRPLLTGSMAAPLLLIPAD